MNSPQQDKETLLLYTSAYESRQESPSDSFLPKLNQELPSHLHFWKPSFTNPTSMNQNDPSRDQTSELSPGGRSTQNIWSASTTNLDPSYGYHRGATDMNAADTSSYYPGSIYSGGSQSFYGAGTNNEELGLSVDMSDTHGLSNRMGQLHLGTSQQNHLPDQQRYFVPGSGLVSVPTIASGNSSTVPGVIGASSGSTGGSTTRSTTSSWGYSKELPQDRMGFQLHRKQGYSEPPGFGRESKRLEYRPPFPSKPTFGGSAHSAPGDDSFSLESRTTGKSQSHNPGGANYQDHRRNQQKHEKKGGRTDNRRHQDSRSQRNHYPNDGRDRIDGSTSDVPLWSDDFTTASSKGSSEAIRMLMHAPVSTDMSTASSNVSGLAGNRLPLDDLVKETSNVTSDRPILPSIDDVYPLHQDEDSDDVGDGPEMWGDDVGAHSPTSKKKEWLLRMNRRMQEIPVGQLDPASIPVSAIMNAWAKTKSAQGASMVELWLRRVQDEADAGNIKVVPNTKLFTMAVDAWAKSGEGGTAAQKAESILQGMHALYLRTGHEHLRPTTGIFNAVINAWARSKEEIAPSRAEQILDWMDKLRQTNPSIQIRPDKFTYNTVIHAYAKSGGAAAASKAQELLARMHTMNEAGNHYAKPDTITYNVVINAWAKSGGQGAALETERLLARMHQLHHAGDRDIKPNVVTYGAVIDSFAKSGEKGAATKADTLLAKMIQLYQSDPVGNSDLRPNTYVFNTVINCWAKSKEPDAASKAEEMLLAMSKLHASGMPNLKPDAFTYTAVIDAWSKSGYRGAAARADQLLDKMEAKYVAGDMALRPNSFTYNAVINALAKSGEPGAAARAERVLQNMVNRHRQGAGDDCKPTTINFNTILDAWAKSGGGRQAAERAEEILEWMDRLHKGGNSDCQPDTISFNAVIDAWARSGDRMAPHRAEQILDHMDELYRAGDKGKKPDVYSYNTLINAWAKSTERGSAARAEHVLRVMKQRYADGDADFKPNTRTMTSVIDAWAKSGEKGAARRAEQILDSMIEGFEATRDPDTKPNVHTANAVCNACAFTKVDADRSEALQIAFRVFKWLASQTEMQADAYTYTILLSVCSNLLPRDDTRSRFSHAKSLFEQCCAGGYVNEYVLRKLRQTVSTEDYIALTGTRGETTISNLPEAWTRSIGRYARVQVNKGRKKGGDWGQRKRK